MSKNNAAKTGIRIFKVGCLGIIIVGILLAVLVTKVVKRSGDERKRIDKLPRLTATVRAEEIVGFPFSDADAVFGQLAGEYMTLGSGDNNRTNYTNDINVNIIPESLKLELEGTEYSLSHNSIVHFDGFRTGESITVYRDDPEEERRRFVEAYRGLNPELDVALKDLMDSGSRLHKITLNNYYFLDGDQAEFAGEIDGDVIRLLE